MMTHTTATLDTSPTQTEKPVKSVKTAPAAPPTVTDLLAVAGFTYAVDKGATLDESLLRPVTSRATTNPWYPMIVAVAGMGAAVVTITRDADSKAKSPVSALKTARNRALDLGIKHAGKLEVRSANDKGTWYLIRRP